MCESILIVFKHKEQSPILVFGTLSVENKECHAVPMKEKIFKKKINKKMNNNEKVTYMFVGIKQMVAHFAQKNICLVLYEETIYDFLNS